MRITTIILFTLGFINPSCSQSVNYKELFGDDWKKAETFERENRIWMEPILLRNNISYPLAVSIVFPELVRYSALSDKMEIGLLKTLYVNLGDEYADFSIGQFQMKPSFAELIRENSATLPEHSQDITFKRKTGFEDIKDFRRSIIKDLEDPESQLKYLIAFIKICEKDFQTERKDEESLVMFLATAYNFGFDKTDFEIETMTNKKFFSTTLLKTECYSYADVSLFWYRYSKNR